MLFSYLSSFLTRKEIFIMNHINLTKEQLLVNQNWRTSKRQVNWKFDKLSQEQQKQIKQEIQCVFSPEFSQKMLEINPISSLQVAEQLYQLILYEERALLVYDTLFKWMLMKLWGGQPKNIILFSLLSPLLASLTKINTRFKQDEVDLVFAIARQYLISCTIALTISDSIYSTFEYLTAVNSAEQVLSKMLYLLELDLSSIHKHLKIEQQFTAIYKRWVERLINQQLILFPQGKIKYKQIVHRIVSILPISQKEYNLPETVETSPLHKHISKLYPPCQKAILYLNNLFQQYSSDIVNQIKLNAKPIFIAILNSLIKLIQNKKQYASHILKAQISLFQRCIRCPHVISKIERQQLEQAVEFTLKQLLQEDQYSQRKSKLLEQGMRQFKFDNFAEAFDKVMISLIEKANTDQLLNVLIDRLIFYLHPQNQLKRMVILISQCVKRISNKLYYDTKQQLIITFIVKSIELLAFIQFKTPLEKINISSPSDSAANAIKTVMKKLSQSLNTKIWQIYIKSALESRYCDIKIREYLHSLNIGIPSKNLTLINSKKNIKMIAQPFLHLQIKQNEGEKEIFDNNRLNQ